jgi:hypothetical protein
MGEYEPNDSRNVTGTATSPDGRWTGDAANDPTMTDAQRRQAGQGSPGSQQGFAEPFTQQQAAQAGQQGQQSAPQQNMGGSQGAVGQANDGVSDAQNQGNDHTSAIGQNQAAGKAGSGQASYGKAGQGSGQALGPDRTGEVDDRAPGS